ncbi:MAG: aminotransferase class V-fold PLP-dependent enzyme [Theionarchaea archaeon]|nr:aminotransferase class V-fold PLP-dependent enzyme [Theionarchaea archaeon]
MNLDEIRELIPTSQKYVYLNHAACSPLPTLVTTAQSQYLKERSLDAEVAFDSWVEHSEKTRQLIAEFIHASPEEIAFLKNTTEGINVVAHMLTYERGDNVVTTDLEFPSNFLPWLDLKRRGVEFRVVRNRKGRLLYEDFEKALDDHTKCLAVSHVEFATGFKNDLNALANLCSDHGTYFFVDPIQSLGALNWDVTRTPVDFFSSGCYKWLMSELGISIFYIRKELISEFHPPGIGWFSLKDYEHYENFDKENPEIADTARKFEGGNLNFYGIYTLHASLTFLNLFPAVEERVMELSNYLINRLLEESFEVQTPEDHAGIVNFKVRNPREVVERLKKQGIIVSSRAGGIRVSTHFWNTIEELEKLLRAL